MMDPQEEARKLNAEERFEEQHRKEMMTSRSAQEVEKPPTDGMEERAREAIAQSRKDSQHQQETMQSRAAE